MEMSGERLIAASRSDVWAALNDAEVLKACIPGCQEMEKTSDTEFVAKVVQKVGPVKATFTGEIELSDIVEGESYKITGKGKGGAAGGATGGAAVSLEDADGGTRLSYEAEAKVTGKIAQLGARLIDGFAKKMADDFFTRFQEQVEGPAAEAEADVAESTFAEVMDTVEESASDLAHQVEDVAKDVAGKVEEASKEVASNLGEALESAKEAIAEEADSVRERIAKAEPEKKGFWKRLFGG